MDFTIAPEYQQLRSACRRFISTELAGMEAGIGPDRSGEVPEKMIRDVRRRSADLGFYAPDYPEELGGQGLPQLGMTLLREQAFSCDGRLGEYVTAGPEGPSGLLLAGTPDQRERYLVPLVRARASRCLALSEPGAGSDTQALTTRARAQGDGWVINGTKHFITNAEAADFAIVLARTSDARAGADGVTAFLVDKGTPGFNVGRLIPGMTEDSRQYEVHFDDCYVPETQIIGGPRATGQAMYQAIQYFALGRLALAAASIGMADKALRMGIEYAKTRQAFGKTISQYQYVQGHLVDSHVELRAARLLTYDAAAHYDSGQSAMVESSIAKLTATETAYTIVDRVIQVFGGSGWTRDLPLERMLRLLRMYRIVDGTSEIQRVIIGRSLLGAVG